MRLVFRDFQAICRDGVSFTQPVINKPAIDGITGTRETAAQTL